MMVLFYYSMCTKYIELHSKGLTKEIQWNSAESAGNPISICCWNRRHQRVIETPPAAVGKPFGRPEQKINYFVEIFQLFYICGTAVTYSMHCTIWESSYYYQSIAVLLEKIPVAGRWHSHDIMSSDAFYCRYFVGHRGHYGHEFMEFEITSDGKLRYANNSNYKKDFMIRKEGKCIFYSW